LTCCPEAFHLAQRPAQRNLNKEIYARRLLDITLNPETRAKGFLGSFNEHIKQLLCLFLLGLANKDHVCLKQQSTKINT
jgi:hypothetical protein